MPRGKPFQKGDARINHNGRPRAFDALRELALKIANERIKFRCDGEIFEVTRAEAILRQWAASKREIAQQQFITAAFGKVPEELIINPQSAININVRYIDKSNGSGK